MVLINDKKIPKNIIKEIIQLSKKLTINYDWKRNTLLMIDNRRFMHGRKKFKDLNQKRLLLRAWVSPKKFAYKGKTILDAYNDR